VKILKHRETFESRGIAFISFEDTGSTDKAVLLSGKVLLDKTVHVEFAAPKNDKGNGRGTGKGKGGLREKPEGCTTVVIRNLSLNASEDDIWRLIKPCSSASSVSILMDKDTWTSKGVAFVDFDDTKDTEIAVKLSGKEVRGQPVSIDFKRPKW